jgi:hypothetical protein
MQMREWLCHSLSCVQVGEHHGYYKLESNARFDGIPGLLNIDEVLHGLDISINEFKEFSDCPFFSQGPPIQSSRVEYLAYACKMTRANTPFGGLLHDKSKRIPVHSCSGLKRLHAHQEFKCPRAQDDMFASTNAITLGTERRSKFYVQHKVDDQFNYPPNWKRQRSRDRYDRVDLMPLEKHLRQHMPSNANLKQDHQEFNYTKVGFVQKEKERDHMDCLTPEGEMKMRKLA